MSLDNTSCNLASLNLMKFLGDDNTFVADKFVKAVELIITAMDISICFADFPTEAIGVNTRAYRQLGIGYANLGALLMATGSGLRLRRRPRAGRRDHLADDRCRLPPLGRARRHRRPVRRFRPQREGARPGHAQARRCERRGAPVARQRPRRAVRRHRGVGQGQQARRAQRLAQRPGQRARADRHHRLDDGRATPPGSSRTSRW